jgi:hypothetical protein
MAIVPLNVRFDPVPFAETAAPPLAIVILLVIVCVNPEFKFEMAGLAVPPEIVRSLPLKLNAAVVVLLNINPGVPAVPLNVDGVAKVTVVPLPPLITMLL